MSNANRDYTIVYDVKNSLLVLSRPLNFYITDKNTSNIFIKLVTRVIVGNGIDQYTDIENASNYVLTMRVIKPNNEVKSLEATQHEPENIFQFDLTEDFKDMPGKYICELTISTTVSGRQELITSDPFNYEVKRSILSNVGEIIETENTTVEKLLNDLNATKAELSSQIKENENNHLGVSVKYFGAIGDGVTDDTQAIQNALNSDYRTIIMNCNCKISSTLNLPIDKEYIFNGSFIVDDNFKDDKVIYIDNYKQEKNIDKISIIHEKFLGQDYHSVGNTIRTNFDGVVINYCRKLNIKNITVVGLTTRAIVVNQGYETTIDKIDVWGSNLTDDCSVLTSATDNLIFTQNSRYTCGVVIDADDGIYKNIVSVGFNVGVSTQNANMINNFHPWGYKSSMVYGLVVKGSYNIVNNLYLDTIKPINERTGAGVYEWKISDGNTASNSVERNKYNNITTLSFDDNSFVFELGDNERSLTSFATIVTGLSPQFGAKCYKLHGGSVGLPTLDKLFEATTFNIFSTELSNLKFNKSESFQNIIGEIIENNLPTIYDNPCGLIFVDTAKTLTSKLPDDCGLKNQQAIIKIESYSKKYYRCSVQGYGYPNSNSYILDVFRADNGNKDYYASLDCKQKVLSWLPDVTNYSVGECIFYKNKPIWRSSEGYWVDAIGTQVN